MSNDNPKVTPLDPEGHDHDGLAVRLAWGGCIWVAEAFIGLIPLVAGIIVHTYARLPPYVVNCQGDKGNGVFEGCVAAPDGLDAEKCILAVVLAGLAGLTSLVRWRKPGIVLQRVFRFVGILMLFAFPVVGTLLYALILSGDSRNTGPALDLLLIGTLSASFILAIEREI